MADCSACSDLESLMALSPSSQFAQTFGDLYAHTHIHAPTDARIRTTERNSPYAVQRLWALRLHDAIAQTLTKSM